MRRLHHRWKGASAKGHMVRVIRAVLAVLVAMTWTVSAREMAPRAFSSPQEAMRTLVEALQAGDQESLRAILGPESEELLSSGDPVSDKADRERFLKAYAEKVDLAERGDDRVEVILGNDNWPFPIPIVKEGESWSFDTKAGKEELLNRRIGRNELDTIEVCQAYVEAQREYASADREQNGVIEYAQKMISDPNKRNGLYWEVAEGELQSPLGPFMASAAAEGYKRGDRPIPYHGYYFRILKGQGSKAPGGAYSYVIHGYMVAGFALVAWPAEYGSSGVTTFVVNRNGIVYEKDLGPKTAQIAAALTRYNPDETWKRAQ